MIIKNIEIKNFRNYSDLKLILKPNINIIYGNNGAGKTNLLESIYVLAFTKSHRSFIDNNLIKYGENNAKIKGTILNGLSYNLEINLGKTTKKVKLDGNQISKLGDYIEKSNIIIFTSDDLELIKGFSSQRRKYLNLEISQISKTYFNVLNDYNKLLKIRNDYLKQVTDSKKINQNYFDTLTEYIVEKSVFIYQMRIKYIEKLNKECKKIYKQITGLDNFEIKYIPSIITKTNSREEIKKIMTEKLKNNLEKEIMLKSTLYGPHKDDFEFTVESKNLKNFGSQGQQRAAVLTLKLSEIELIENYKKSSPIILLDDVFSELDQKTINNLLFYINKGMQIIITTTDLENIKEELKSQANLLHVVNGKIENEV